MSKFLKLAFVASITLNLLFVGVLVGQLSQRFEGRSSPQERMAAAVEALPEPARSRVRGSLEQMRRDLDPIREQMQKTRDETIDIFVRDPFDESAYDRHVNRIAELRLQMNKSLGASMKEIAKELPGEQRKLIAQAFQRPPRQR